MERQGLSLPDRPGPGLVRGGARLERVVRRVKGLIRRDRGAHAIAAHLRDTDVLVPIGAFGADPLVAINAFAYRITIRAKCLIAIST